MDIHVFHVDIRQEQGEHIALVSGLLGLGEFQEVIQVLLLRRGGLIHSDQQPHPALQRHGRVVDLLALLPQRQVHVFIDEGPLVLRMHRQHKGVRLRRQVVVATGAVMPAGQGHVECKLPVERLGRQDVEVGRLLEQQRRAKVVVVDDGRLATRTSDSTSSDRMVSFQSFPCLWYAEKAESKQISASLWEPRIITIQSPAISIAPA